MRGLVKSGFVLATAGMTFLSSYALGATELRLLSMQSNDGPKKALQALADRFTKENPEITVKIETIEHEGFKAGVENYLKDPKTDVITQG